jgi:hypothetical protein
MISCERAREIALALAEVQEKDHRGRPSFCVRDKIFATLWLDERRAVIKATILDQAAFVESNPEVFSIVPGWGKQGWTFVHLDHVNERSFRDVLAAAWRHVAPKSIANARQTNHGKRVDRQSRNATCLRAARSCAWPA